MNALAEAVSLTRPASEGLFSGGVNPPAGGYRSVRVTEDCEALVRVHQRSAGKDLAYMDGGINNDSATGLRSLLAAVLEAAYRDLASGMAKDDPMQRNRRVGAKTVSNDNHEFQSAVSFFFGQYPLTDDDGVSLKWYSAFNSYCKLLDMDAGRIRRTLLERFEGLGDIIFLCIRNPDFVAPVRGLEKRVTKGGVTTLKGTGELFF